ncbi:MAG: hypothetical protein GDA48_24250 [Hormoscilla sp. GM102CHS1]|nr:hypothetical protein [Hormoscilla sp. GM102CHS1]
MNKSPEEYIQSMRTALEQGDLKTAQELAASAVKIYPDAVDIQQCAYVLAPTKVTSSPSTPEKRKMIRANLEWKKQNREKYRSRWVAVRSGELLADASSFDELVEQLDGIKDVLLTVIY